MIKPNQLFLIIGILVVITLGALVVKLFDRGNVIYTDQEVQTSPNFSRDDPRLGSLAPQLVITTYGNFACLGCSSSAQHLVELTRTTSDRILLVWKDLPNPSLDEESYRAAIAARCAQRQDAFWQYHDLLFSHQNNLGDELYIGIAQELDLRLGTFKRCLKKEKTAHLVDAGLKEAAELGIPGAPALFLNNTRHVGVMSASDIERLIEAALAP